MQSSIPIQNIYYLLIYAWDYLDEGGLVNVEDIDGTELVDLYAAVLWSGVRHLSRRGLHQDYVDFEEDIAGIRGRINVAVTARRMLAQHGRAQCIYDELHVDTLPNQILLATTRLLLRSNQLDSALRKEGLAIERGLRQITQIPLSNRTFRSLQLYRSNRTYRFVLDLCRLIVDMSFVTEARGDVQFRDFLRDPKALAALYEKFLFNFYRREKPDAEIRSDRIRWDAVSSDDPELSLLPVMQTDISMRTTDRTLVIDAKFYENTLQARFGSETVHSHNLYQLFAYLQNLRARGEQASSIEGMLLYPTITADLRKEYRILGHNIGVATVDLCRPWQDIKARLLELVA